jgi:hypothetical protein
MAHVRVVLDHEHPAAPGIRTLVAGSADRPADGRRAGFPVLGRRKPPGTERIRHGATEEDSGEHPLVDGAGTPEPGQ